MMQDTQHRSLSGLSCTMLPPQAGHSDAGSGGGAAGLRHLAVRGLALLFIT